MRRATNPAARVPRQERGGELLKAPTGIRGLDEIACGGLPAGRPAARLRPTRIRQDELYVRKSRDMAHSDARVRGKDATAMPLPKHRTAPPSSDAKAYRLRLYVAGRTPKSVLAFRNLKRICEQHLQERYEIEIVDLLENPQLARGDQILAVPTLVRRLPKPIRKVIGDLSNTERVLIGLDVRTHGGGTR